MTLAQEDEVDTAPGDLERKLRNSIDMITSKLATLSPSSKTATPTSKTATPTSKTATPSGGPKRSHKKIPEYHNVTFQLSDIPWSIGLKIKKDEFTWCLCYKTFFLRC